MVCLGHMAELVKLEERLVLAEDDFPVHTTESQGHTSSGHLSLSGLIELMRKSWNYQHYFSSSAQCGIMVLFMQMEQHILF